jgi:ApaG protein
MGSSQARTRGILVEVDSSFVPERSEPMRRMWFFAYRIRIANQGEETVQLVSRHWIITDAHGEVEEVSGPGVVGEQPVLAPGEAFEYTSFCPLPTPFGSMRGSYQMVTRDGETFDIEIAPFELSQPLPVN